MPLEARIMPISAQGCLFKITASLQSIPFFPLLEPLLYTLVLLSSKSVIFILSLPLALGLKIFLPLDSPGHKFKSLCYHFPPFDLLL